MSGNRTDRCEWLNRCGVASSVASLWREILVLTGVDRLARPAWPVMGVGDCKWPLVVALVEGISGFGFRKCFAVV